jgi:glucokinase
VVKIGVDLGGTKIYVVAVEEGRLVGETKAKTPTQGGPLAIVDAIASAVRQLAVGSPLEAVGVGAPGAVDPERGVVRRAPNLRGWLEPFGLGPAVSDALDGVRVIVDNDVNVGMVAEHQVGAGRGCDNLLGLFVGTGVGGALILDGELRRGPSGFAGEIGHMTVRPGGRICGCGGRGHLEAYAGRAGMERRARQLDSRGRDTLLVELSRARRMTSSVFAKALDAGDKVAVSLVSRAVEALGQAVAAAVLTLDVPLVVVGGGLADRLGPAFVARTHAAAVSFLPPDQADVFQTVPGRLADRGGALGAALLVGAVVDDGIIGADGIPAPARNGSDPR